MNAETVGKFFAPIAAAIAPAVADAVADRVEAKLDEAVAKLPEVAEKVAGVVLDRLLPHLPDLDKIDDQIRAAVREVFNSLPLPFKL